MCMWKWIFRNAEKWLVLFFHHAHAYMHTIHRIYRHNRFSFLSNSGWKDTLVLFHVKGIQKYLFVHLKSAKEVEQFVGRARRSFTACNKGSWQRALEWNAHPREMLLMEGFCKLLSSQSYQTVPPQKQTLIMQKTACQGQWYKWIVKASHRQAAG